MVNMSFSRKCNVIRRLGRFVFLFFKNDFFSQFFSFDKNKDILCVVLKMRMQLYMTCMKRLAQLYKTIDILTRTYHSIHLFLNIFEYFIFVL